MLYLLTGEIQTGKTRWLERRAARAAEAGVRVYGVLAPGVWHEDGAGGFEKLGIDNVLLPQNERIHLAERRDIAQRLGSVEPDGPSERARLGWAMSNAALARVNEHFSRLACEAAQVGGARGLLVVDELGRLELMRGEGLTAALDLLRRGPQPAWEDAVVVVRAGLLDRAHDALDSAWGGAVHVLPGSQKP